MWEGVLTMLVEWAKKQDKERVALMAMVGFAALALLAFFAWKEYRTEAEEVIDEIEAAEDEPVKPKEGENADPISGTD